MADNTVQNGTDTIATDDLTSLNGGAVTGVKAQRVKVGYGDDASFRDASQAFPFPIQDRKDIGRTNVTIQYSATAPPTTDTLLTTLTLNKGATSTANQTSIPVTSGKALRITGVVVGTRATVATLPYGLVTLRVNYTGAAVIGSPAQAQIPVSGTAAVIGNTGATVAALDDMIELTGTAQLGISFSGNLATNVVTISIIGYEY